MEKSKTTIDIFQSYLCMKINSLEVQKLKPDESRHHKRMANFMLEAGYAARYRTVPAGP